MHAFFLFSAVVIIVVIVALMTTADWSRPKQNVKAVVSDDEDDEYETIEKPETEPPSYESLLAAGSIV